MNTRNFKQSTPPTKNQEMSIEYKGRIYAICSEEQMNYLLMVEREKIIMEDADKVYRKEKKPIAEAEIVAKLEAFREKCEFNTLAYVLSKMTPQEQEEWKNKYRFAPIIKSRQ